MIQSARMPQGKDCGDDSEDTPEVDLYQLQVSTLKRYKKHYKLQSRPTLNKAQLVEVSLWWVSLNLKIIKIKRNWNLKSDYKLWIPRVKTFTLGISILSRANALQVLSKHFKGIPVNEKEVITYFLYTVKTEGNKLDNNR